MKRPSTRATGFSLLELLAVVTIIGIISALVLSRISIQAFDAKKKCCLRYKRDLNAAIEQFHFDQGVFPAQLSDLQGPYYPDVIPICPVDNSSYTIDGTTNRVQGHQH